MRQPISESLAEYSDPPTQRVKTPTRRAIPVRAANKAENTEPHFICVVCGHRLRPSFRADDPGYWDKVGKEGECKACRTDKLKNTNETVIVVTGRRPLVTPWVKHP